MSGNWKAWQYAIAGAAAVAVLSGAPALAQDAKARLAGISPVTDDMLQKPADGDWLTYRRTLNGWGYSPLNQINTGNVAKLDLAWSRMMNTGILEITPLVHDGIMFLPHPGDVLQAIDAATGDMLWEYRRAAVEGAYSLGERKRSVALYGNNVYMATWDNHILAIDMKTGQIAWDTERSGGLDVTNSTGPIAMKGVVATGSTCSYTYPGGCYAAGYDANSGEELWLNYVNPRRASRGMIAGVVCRLRAESTLACGAASATIGTWTWCSTARRRPPHPRRRSAALRCGTRHRCLTQIAGLRSSAIPVRSCGSVSSSPAPTGTRSALLRPSSTPLP
jgi:hypothetical protein